MPEKNRVEGTGYATPLLTRAMAAACAKPYQPDDPENSKAMREAREYVRKEGWAAVGCAMWMGGKPIVEAASEVGCDPEEIFDFYKRRHPLRARIIEKRAHLGIALGVYKSRLLGVSDRLVGWMARRFSGGKGNRG